MRVLRGSWFCQTQPYDGVVDNAKETDADAKGDNDGKGGKGKGDIDGVTGGGDPVGAAAVSLACSVLMWGLCWVRAFQFRDRLAAAGLDDDNDEAEAGGAGGSGGGSGSGGEGGGGDRPVAMATHAPFMLSPV